MTHPADTNLDVNAMTIDELRTLPCVDGGVAGLSKATRIVVVPRPLDELHDSGYAMMDFVVCEGSKPVGRLAAWSDVVHIDGIGGMGEGWLERYGRCPTLVPPIGWSIDCLAGSGCLRLFPSSDYCDGIIVEREPLSSFELFGRLREDRDPRPSPVKEVR